MKIIRYLTEQKEETFGWVQEDKVGAILGTPFEHYRRLEAVTPIQRVQFLPPLQPGKIISIQNNYVFQGKEDQVVPEIPVFFLKPAQSILGTRENVTIPAQTNDLVAQGELAVVVGKQGRWIPLNQAYDHIIGYTCAATFYARDLYQMDGYAHYRSFYFDSFSALGPWIETELDPNDIVISTSLNKSLIHMTTSHEMLFSIPQLVTFLSSIMTLMPGDVILTGATNPGIHVSHNDFHQVEIDGIGVLNNMIMNEERPWSI